MSSKNNKTDDMNKLMYVLSKENQLHSNNQCDWSYYEYLERIVAEADGVQSQMNSKIFAKNDRKQAVDKFIQWSRDNGAEFPGVTIKSIDQYEMGLFAEREFKQNEMFVKIPKKMMMTIKSCDKEIQEVIDKLKVTQHNSILMLILMVEKLKPNSSWRPYIDILPKKYSIPLYYTRAQMEIIKDTEAFVPAVKLFKSIMVQHTGWYLGLVTEINTTHTLESNSVARLLKDCLTLELVRWARATVMTRQNLIPHLDEGSENVEMIPALIPFWDMANHSPNGYLSTDYNDSTDTVESFTINDINRGDQINIYYGDRHNTDMLINNGFFCRENDFGLSFQIKCNYQLPLYQKYGFHDATTFLPISYRPNYVTSKLLTAIRICVMDETTVNEWMNKTKGEELTCLDYKFPDETLEKKVWKYIWLTLTLRLKNRQTEDEISEELKNLNMNRKKRGQISSMLIEYRGREAEVFRKTLSYAKQKLDALEKPK